MTLNRTNRLVAAGVLVLLMGAPALAQDLQLFAPAEVSCYGSDLRPHEGYFFSFDELYWSIPAPKNDVVVGVATPRDVTSTTPNYVETSGNRYRFKNDFRAGERISLGKLYDHDGWLVESYWLRPQELGYAIGTQSDVVMNDPLGLFQNGEGNNIPMTFGQLLLQNRTDTWSIETSYLKRSEMLWNGGYVEGIFGARYLEFNDQSQVTGTGGTYGGGWWMTKAENHIPALQVGLRYFKQYGRFMFNTEGRFIGGLNCQNWRQEGAIGPTNGPAVWGGTSFSSQAYKREFTPGVDLRLEGRYLLTKSLSFRAGWQGIFLNNISRANNSVNYTLPDMGIISTNNHQNVFLNGLTIGFDINR